MYDIHVCEYCNKLNCSCIMHDTERTISDYTSHLHGQSKEECISTKVADEHCLNIPILIQEQTLFPQFLTLP